MSNFLRLERFGTLTPIRHPSGQNLNSHKRLRVEGIYLYIFVLTTYIYIINRYILWTDFVQCVAYYIAVYTRIQRTINFTRAAHAKFRCFCPITLPKCQRVFRLTTHHCVLRSDKLQTDAYGRTAPVYLSSRQQI